MEPDEFKLIWEQYDKKLSDSLRLNETVLKKMNLDKAKRELNVTFRYEAVNVVIGFMGLVLIAAFIVRQFGDARFVTLGALAFLLGAFYLAVSVMRINMLSHIDYFGASVVEVQRRVAAFNRSFLKFRKWEMALIPMFVVSILGVAFKGVRNIDLFARPVFCLVEIGLALLITFPLVIWTYRYFYEKRIADANRHLDEIDQFVKEA